MKRYKITLIKDMDFPQSPEFLKSPIGIFCREMDRKKWLTADEGSPGHQLMRDFARAFPGCFFEELQEIDWNAELQEEIAFRSSMEDAHLQHQLWQRTQLKRVPRHTIFRVLGDGQRQAWNGAKWEDVENE